MIRLLIIMLGSWCGMAVSAPADGNPPPRPRAETLARACSGCHGREGNPDSLVPALDRTPSGEFVQTMRDFKSGRRVSSIMNRIAKGYEDADFVAMAQYFAQGGQ